MVLVRPFPFTLHVGRGRGQVVVTLHGELDCATGPLLVSTLGQVIEQQGNVDVVIDLSGLTFMDSTGMSALLAGRRMANETRASLVLRGTQPRVQRVFEMSGLTDRFTFAST